MSKLGRYSADRKKIDTIGAATTLTVADCGTIFMVSNFTGDIILPSVASAGKGWWCKLVMTADLAAGNITVDLSGSDTIELAAAAADGAAVTLGGGTAEIQLVSGKAKKGDQVELFTDGSTWYALVHVADKDGVISA